MTVPVDVLCRPGEPRRLMRSALSDLWPAKLRNRRSKGLFNAPWQEALHPLAQILLKAKHLNLVELGFVDRASVDTNGNLRLPPLVHDLEIDYTALSLVAPEKVRFRY